MKPYYILLISLCFSPFFNGQIGIGTSDPKGSFHVDAGKNNNPVVQPDDDVIIQSGTGNVGIGTTDPTSKLHLNGKIRITDGSQGPDRILVSNANGLAKWVYPAIKRNNSVGINPNPVVTINSGQTANNFNYSGFSITLTEGKWLVSSSLTFSSIGRNGSSPLPNVNYWMRAYLSTSNTDLTNIKNVGFTHLGPAGPNTAFGGPLVATNYTQDVGSIYGSSVIEVTVPSVTVYLLMDQKPAKYYMYSSNYFENYFYAVPID